MACHAGSMPGPPCRRAFRLTAACFWFSRTRKLARGCFQWALLYDLDGRLDETITWLERAVRLEPGDYWSQFYLGYYHQRAGHIQKALEHDQAAVAFGPTPPGPGSISGSYTVLPTIWIWRWTI